jgi:hypothetical protein
VFQKRACFTELAPSGLKEHSKLFEPFAIELTVENLRLLGGIPVFYVPPPGKEERALGGMAAALIARMADIQQLLTRLDQIHQLAQRTPDKDELINVTVNDRPAGGTRCTIGAAEDFVSVLSYQIQPPGELLNAVRALGGFFYPTEDLTYTGELAYYRQREWRIIANMVHRGREVARDLSGDERATLCLIDAEFFGRQMHFPTGEHCRVDQCKYITDVDAVPFLSWASRLIVPDEVTEAAGELLQSNGCKLPVAALSSL